MKMVCFENEFYNRHVPCNIAPCFIALYKSLDKCLYRRKVSSYFELTYFMLKCQTLSAAQLDTAWTYFIKTLPTLWLLIINARSTVSTNSLFKKFRVSFWRTQFVIILQVILWSNMLLFDFSYLPSQTLVIFQMCEDKSYTKRCLIKSSQFQFWIWNNCFFVLVILNHYKLE